MRASLPFTDTSCKPQSVTVYLFQIVRDAEEIPLRIYLTLSPEGESIKPDDRSDMGKGRFAYCQPHTVKYPTDSRIDFTLHSLGESIQALFRSSDKISNLAYFCTFRMTQALGTQRTGQTSRLRPLE